EVVALGVGLHHRGWVLAETTLTEVVEVAVDLPRPLRRDNNGGVMRIGVVEKLVYAWFDHSAKQCRRAGRRDAKGFGPRKGGPSGVPRLKPSRSWGGRKGSSRGP